MSHTYGKELKFIVFEVKIKDCWLSVPQAEDFVQDFQLEFIPYVKIKTSLEEIDKERDSDSIIAIRRGIGPGKIKEGVVLRPLQEFTKNNGDRVICKHKRLEFTERQHPPKVVDLNRLEVLTQAEAIANEWVVPMRLEHILQKLPQNINMEQTSDVIRAMIDDVYREAKGEIVESKEVKTAIGKKTAQIFRQHLQQLLHYENKTV